MSGLLATRSQVVFKARPTCWFDGTARPGAKRLVRASFDVIKCCLLSRDTADEEQPCSLDPGDVVAITPNPGDAARDYTSFWLLLVDRRFAYGLSTDLNTNITGRFLELTYHGNKQRDGWRYYESTETRHIKMSRLLRDDYDGFVVFDMLGRHEASEKDFERVYHGRGQCAKGPRCRGQIIVIGPEHLDDLERFAAATEGPCTDQEDDAQ